MGWQVHTLGLWERPQGGPGPGAAALCPGGGLPCPVSRAHMVHSATLHPLGDLKAVVCILPIPLHSEAISGLFWR